MSRTLDAYPMVVAGAWLQIGGAALRIHQSDPPATGGSVEFFVAGPLGFLGLYPVARVVIEGQAGGGVTITVTPHGPLRDGP